YDSWKSIMELYMMNRQHERMILKSVKNGPLIWPSIEENRVTRPKKYSELSATEAIQADCDVKTTNIILQGLPPEVYALVSNHKVSKELWERIQLLMQGTSMTKQERECKLYDEFDTFTYKKGDTLQIDIVILVVETESSGMSDDKSDKKIGLSDGLQPKQADLSFVHALNKPYLHEIHVVLRTHEANQ
nr:hypothetical protein [Tanacetum cinerariifolium]